MSDELANESGDTGGDTLSADEIAQLRADAEEGRKLKLANARAEFVTAAKLDPANPSTELVLDRFWSPDTRPEDFTAIAEQYGIVVKEKTETEQRDTPPPPVTDYERDRNALTGEVSTPDVPRIPNIYEETRRIHTEMIQNGGSAEDAVAAAMHANLQWAARQQREGTRRGFRTDEAGDGVDVLRD